MTSNNYACKDGFWGRCGALGDALRRASEAERRVVDLEERLKAFSQVLDAATQMKGTCPACGSIEYTLRGLKREEIDAGLCVCSKCYTKHEV